MRRTRLLVAVLVGLAAGVAAVGAHVSGVLDRTERDAIDARFDLRGTQPPPPDVLVVAVDDRTLSRLGRFPPRRRVWARAIDRLAAAGARGVVVDVQFDTPGRRDDDLAMLEAARRAGTVVFGTTLVDRGEPAIFVDPSELERFRSAVGDARYPLDRGVFRRLAYENEGAPTLPRVAVERVTGTAIPRERFAGDGVLVDLPGPSGTIATVSLIDLLAGRVPAARIRGRIAVIGATAAALQDRHPTALGQQAGAEIQAAAIQTLLDDVPLRDLPAPVALLAILALGLLAPLTGLARPGGRGRAVVAVATTAGAAAAWLGLAWLGFLGPGLVVPVVAPLVALALGSFGTLAALAGEEAGERRRVRGLFARFVGDAVVDDVLASAGGDLRLAGRRRVGTVLMCDLRGFTTCAERLEPERVVALLNHYLETMGDAVLAHGGTLVTYLGDGILAVFGAPLAQEDHADRALRCALEMLGDGLRRFNAALEADGLPSDFELSIGIATGSVMSGHVGTPRRLEYAAVGDTTNLAARLQGATRRVRRPLLVSAATRAALHEGGASLERIGSLQLRGRSEPVEAFAPQLAQEDGVAAVDEAR